jgi:hypothetical protein
LTRSPGREKSHAATDSVFCRSTLSIRGLLSASGYSFKPSAIGSTGDKPCPVASSTRIGTPGHQVRDNDIRAYIDSETEYLKLGAK